jgi:hypothetical protein
VLRHLIGEGTRGAPPTSAEDREGCRATTHRTKSTPQLIGRRSVNDQFAEAVCAAVYDCARCGVEAHNRCNEIIDFSRFRIGEAHLDAF